MAVRARSTNLARTMSSLAEHVYWIFDMDGTLTESVHDFVHIRRELAIPPDAPILEHLDALPSREADLKREQLAALEAHYATLARPQPGVAMLLDTLKLKGAQLGIVTRNSVAIAEQTLNRAGLREYFTHASILGHESAPAKPAPDALRILLEQWSADSQYAVMVGDFKYDLQAGRAVGITTVYFDPHSSGEWTALADYRVSSFAALLHLTQQTK